MYKTLFVVLLAFNFILFAQEDDINGRKAPNFKLESLSGDYVELNDFIGKGPVLISFWATWCKPCLEELTEYQKIYNEYKDSGFNLLAISIDDVRTMAKVKPFVKSKRYDFPVLLDTNSDVARLYYAQAIPFTVLVDKNGTIVYSHLGYMRGDEEVIKEKVQELMKATSDTGNSVQ